MAKQNDDFPKAIGLTVQSAEITSELLRSMFRDFLKNTEANKSGRITLSKLAESGIKLDEVKISSQNIGEFRSTAQKYNISYALLKNPATEPPTWQVMFKSDSKNKDTFERAFRDFAEHNQKKQTPILQAENISKVENIKQQQERSDMQKQEKKREHNRENHDEPNM